MTYELNDRIEDVVNDWATRGVSKTRNGILDILELVCSVRLWLRMFCKLEGSLKLGSICGLWAELEVCVNASWESFDSQPSFQRDWIKRAESCKSLSLSHSHSPELEEVFKSDKRIVCEKENLDSSGFQVDWLMELKAMILDQMHYDLQIESQNARRWAVIEYSRTNWNIRWLLKIRRCR